MLYLWQNLLYNPIFNVLLWLYNNVAGQNLGLALIELTVALRLLLIPFTIIGMRARTRFDQMARDIYELECVYKDDPVGCKEAKRELLKRHRINPWAKAVVLGVQFLVIIILYRVFVTAVGTGDFTGLYRWNTMPDFLNTEFLGFDLASQSAVWSGAVAVILYLDLWISQRRRKATLTNTDVIYRVLFPLASFAVLYLLPMAKSLFVLTSIAFTVIIEFIRWLFWRPEHPQVIMGGLERIEIVNSKP